MLNTSNISINYLNDKGSPNLNRRLIIIYTVLLVLKKMRDRLGIEAMLDFLDSYTKAIERIKPEIKNAVNNELLDRALQELHQTVCRYEK